MRTINFINVFKKEQNRSSIYAYASQLISMNKQIAGYGTAPA